MGSEQLLPPNLSRRIFLQPPPVADRRRSPPKNVAGSAMRGEQTLKRAVLSASPIIAAARLRDLRSFCAKTLEIGEETGVTNRMDLSSSTKESETKEEEGGPERSSPPPHPPPEKPLPGDCCGSGCVRCVWDVYYEELEDYNKAYQK